MKTVPNLLVALEECGMTTAPVVSLTDELIAELEQLAEDSSDLTPDSDAQEYLGNLASRSTATILALLAERAELKRDADRYRYQFDTGEWDYRCGWLCSSKDSVDADIDAAMQEAKQ